MNSKYSAEQKGKIGIFQAGIGGEQNLNLCIQHPMTFLNLYWDDLGKNATLKREFQALLNIPLEHLAGPLSAMHPDIKAHICLMLKKWAAQGIEVNVERDREKAEKLYRPDIRAAA